MLDKFSTVSVSVPHNLDGSKVRMRIDRKVANLSERYAGAELFGENVIWFFHTFSGHGIKASTFE